MSRVISDSRPISLGPPSDSRPAPNRADSRIRDPIGRALLILFATKPFLDLFWEYYFFIGPIRVSPTTSIAFLIVVYFLPFRVKHAQYAPPYARVFEAFIALNLAGIVIGLATNPQARGFAAFETMIRILGCYLTFFCAYAAARRYEYTDARPFLKAMVIGTAIAVILNLAAIKLGFGGQKVGSEYTRGPYREVGLYFDAGSLGAFAFYNLAITVFFFHAARSGKSFWLVATVALVLIDLYLMALSGSRAPMVQTGIAAMFYAWYLRGWGRIAAPIVAVLILLVTATVLVDQPGNVFERFQGDVAAIESDGSGIGETMSGKVSLGKYEALGNNRGMLWANALTAIFHQSGPAIIFGSYFSRIGAHSDYIDILARNGIVGLGLYVFLIYGLCLKTLALGRRANREDYRLLQTLACLLLASYAFYCFPFRPLVYTTVNWYMWTIVALALATIPRVTRRALPGVAASAGTPPSGTAPRPGPVGWQAGRSEPIRRT